MLGAKTVLIAACVALALGQSAAASESRLRVRIHNKDASCGSGQSPMSVEGVEGVFCVSGQACVADIDGACPGAQTGLPYGAYCGTVKTGVKGCIPCAEGECDSDDSAECGDGESPMSVEGVEGIFCVSGQACVADINGACPGVQDGLPYGSSCGIVKTGVYGCKPNSAHHHHKSHKSHHKSHHKDTTCGSGQSPMSVEGVEGVFCVSGQACVADIDGACPGAQTGLPYGAYCGTVKTGVKGCIPCAEGECDSDDSAECGDGESPMSVEGVEGIFCVSGQACVADINGSCPGVQDGLPYGSSCGIVKTGVYGCKPNSAHHHHHKSHHKDTTCGSGQSPMSVEGVEGVFCVSGQACVADIDGACPGAQTGLPYGAYCGTVKTGVKGCIPCAEGECDSDDSAECGDGESPMSVEGVEGIFCVSGQACVADINGACPGVQDGLPYGSSCGIVKTGVYGCKPNSAHHHHKSRKSHKKAHHL